MLQLSGSGRIDSTPWCWSQGAAMDGFTACFEGLDDPRTGNAGRCDLLEMLMIALCTVLSGGEDCTDMAEFARTKLAFLRGFLKLEHGAPSHDTEITAEAATDGIYVVRTSLPAATLDDATTVRSYKS